MLLAGCAKNLQHAQLNNIPLAEKPAIPATQSACEAAGQFWTQQGLSGGPKSCAFKTTNDLPEGAQAIGSCSEWVTTFGCYKFIDGGRVSMICAD